MLYLFNLAIILVYVFWVVASAVALVCSEIIWHLYAPTVILWESLRGTAAVYYTYISEFINSLPIVIKIKETTIYGVWCSYTQCVYDSVISNFNSLLLPYYIQFKTAILNFVFQSNGYSVTLLNTFYEWPTWYLHYFYNIFYFFFTYYFFDSTSLLLTYSFILKLVISWFFVVWLRLNLLRFRFDQVASYTWHELVVYTVFLVVESCICILVL